MSWRSKKTNRYNRSEENEYWLFVMNSQIQCSYYPLWYDDDEDVYNYTWWDYVGGGFVANMKEYHQMKVLTLLRKLDLSNAKSTTNHRGW